MANKLRAHWSAEQIAGWLKRAYPEQENRHLFAAFALVNIVLAKRRLLRLSQV